MSNEPSNVFLLLPIAGQRPEFVVGIGVLQIGIISMVEHLFHTLSNQIEDLSLSRSVFFLFRRLLVKETFLCGEVSFIGLDAIDDEDEEKRNERG